MFSLLGLLSALRGVSVGNDTAQFSWAYRTIGHMDWSDANRLRYEYGFYYLCKFLNLFSSDPQWLLVISSILIFFSVGLFIYRFSPDVMLSTFLFIALGTYSMNLNLLRQSMAIAVLLFALPFLFQKTKKFIGVVLASSLFHKTALIWLIFLSVRRIRYSKQMIITHVLIAIACFFSSRLLYNYGVMMFKSYSIYTRGKFDFSNYNGTLIITIMYVIIFLLGFYFFWTRKKRVFVNLTDNYTPIPIPFQAHANSLLIISLVIGTQMVLLVRVKEYFIPFSWLWLPTVFSIELNKTEKILFKYFLILFSFAYYLIVHIYRPEWHGVVPYVFYWNDYSY